MSEENKPEEVKPAENAEGNTAEKAERPEENWKAELERKNREIERLRVLAAQRVQEPVKRDQNDIRTWNDHELKAIVNSTDPTVAPYKDQANDILLERKVVAIRSRERETENRVKADLELKSQYPDAVDPASELSAKMDELTEKYDLSKTPAGRLVAAKLASAELNQGKSASDAKGRKKESDRLAAVKGQMVDGDRPKPTETDGNLDVKRKELANKLADSRNEGSQVDAISQILKDRGLTRDNFFKR